MGDSTRWDRLVDTRGPHVPKFRGILREILHIRPRTGYEGGMRRPRLPAVAALSVVALLLGGCVSGGGDESASAEGAPSADVRVGLVDYSFTRSAGALLATTVTLTVTNAGSTDHDLQLLDGEEVLGATRVLAPGEAQTITVDLSGLEKVTFLCTLPGHEEMGMVEDVDVVPEPAAMTSFATHTPQEEFAQ